MRGSRSLLNAYIQLHLLVVIWSFTAILGRLISLSPVELVVYRTLLASVGVWFLIRWKKVEPLTDAKTVLIILAVGTLISLHWITFFLAARISNISICLAGLATTSLWTSFLEPIANKRKVLWYEPFLGVLSVAGISVIFNTVFDQYLGLVVGVISAFLAAAFNVINAKLVKRYHHHSITFYEMVGAFLMSVTFLPFYTFFISGESINFKVSWADGFYLLILSGVCTVFAYSRGVKLMKQLTAFTVNLTVNLEPVYGVILAVLFFVEEERMPANFYLGGGLVLLAVLIHPMIKKYYVQRDS